MQSQPSNQIGREKALNLQLQQRLNQSYGLASALLQGVAVDAVDETFNTFTQFVFATLHTVAPNVPGKDFLCGAFQFAEELFRLHVEQLHFHTLTHTHTQNSSVNVPRTMNYANPPLFALRSFTATSTTSPSPTSIPPSAPPPTLECLAERN